ncbi:telomerase reverse transcriptase isoform X3 [Beta vulgaris subsp. vulgaris]|uniref:telomerase reverse transcriptase isoform X3 n=1 Tax=Beta vulgaris subsp. vulgaris TaxID=3555 RepID=UPI0005402CD0|nr:telomerase reverse transcriptase isoform X3 [Beta vulgaris subsp. vulgaris]
MGKKHGRVPNVLWRQFGDKARTLAKTIISLIPRDCNCNAKGKCLRCIFGDGEEAAMSCLIRPHDPSNYRDFMTTCFVVIPHDAPPISALLGFTRHWSQLQFKLHSTIVKVLTSWAWELALERAGDSVMAYILMHTLIFMPVKGNAHQQVAGPLVNRLFARFPVPILPDDSGSSLHARYQQKRRRGSGEISNLEEPVSKVPCRASQQNLLGSAGFINEDYLATHCPKASTMISEKCLHEQHVPEEQNIEKLKVKRGKRLRLPSWQRRKRRKGLILQGSCSQDPSSKVLDNEDVINETCQHVVGNIKCHSLVVPTSDTNSDNQEGAGLRSKQLMQLCPCCSVFQSLSKVSKDAEIVRKLMFYNLKSSASLFLEKHVLHAIKPDFAGVNDLLLHIFGLSKMGTNLPTSCFHKHGLCSHGSSCLYHSLVKLLRDFLHRTKRCPHLVLLKKHCSSEPPFQFDGDGDVGSTLQASNMETALSSSKQELNLKTGQVPKTSGSKRTTEVIQCQFGLSRPYCLKEEVVSFVWAVCRSIVPPDLLGFPSCQRILRRNISRFIRLRRFEKFSLKQCLQKLDVSKFPVLSNMDSFKCFDAFSSKLANKQITGLLPYSRNTSHCALKQMLLERWIFWFFSHIVVPLIRAKFYLTESEHGRQNVFYYRKSVWHKLSHKVASLLKDQTYCSLDNASVAEILSKRSFGFSKVRLCPKENGARPIANLKAPSRFCFKRSLSRAQWSEVRRKKRKGKVNNRTPFMKSVNTVLRDLHVIFKDLKVKEPERWGATVFSYNDIHRKLCSFLRHLKEGRPTMPTVYIVVSDVQKAFDTVKQDKLLSILNEIEMEDQYSLQKSCEIFCRKKSLWISDNLKLMIQGNTGEPTEFAPIRQRISHTVIVNQEQSITVRSEKLKLNLKEHLKNNVLKLGKCFFLQSVGIPQGSILSTLLCTLYYGHLETNIILPYIANNAHDSLVRDDNSCATLEVAPDVSSSSPNNLLLRFVDDFLFISTSKKLAASFFSRLQRGFLEYNCYMNPEKFCMNFDPGDTNNLHLQRMLIGNDGVSFMQWSGLLINSCNLEVQADYSRYLNDHLSSTLTVSWQRKPGRQLKAKLRAYMRPKCHPIFFDTSINSPATIRLNVYQAFVLCAMKFHCYVRALSIWCKLRPHICLSSIESSLRYMYKLMKRRMYKVKCASSCHHVLQVAEKEVTWLGYTAYIQVLSKKKSRHKELLRLLKTALAPVSRIGRFSKLKYAVDESHSSFLWKIKY